MSLSYDFGLSDSSSQTKNEPDMNSTSFWLQRSAMVTSRCCLRCGHALASRSKIYIYLHLLPNNAKQPSAALIFILHDLSCVFYLLSVWSCWPFVGVISFYFTRSASWTIGSQRLLLCSKGVLGKLPNSNWNKLRGILMDIRKIKGSKKCTSLMADRWSKEWLKTIVYDIGLI